MQKLTSSPGTPSVESSWNLILMLAANWKTEGLSTVMIFENGNTIRTLLPTCCATKTPFRNSSSHSRCEISESAIIVWWLCVLVDKRMPNFFNLEGSILTIHFKSMLLSGEYFVSADAYHDKTWFRSSK